MNNPNKMSTRLVTFAMSTMITITTMMMALSFDNRALAYTNPLDDRLPILGRVAISSELYQKRHGKLFLQDLLHELGNVKDRSLLDPKIQYEEQVYIIPRSIIAATIQGRSAKTTIVGEMERHAVQSMLLVDCTPKAHSRAYTDCGLYQFSLSKMKVISVSRHRFKTPVQDVSRWGGKLANNFVANLKAYERLQNEKVMDAMTEHSAEQATKPLHIGIKLGGARIWQIPVVSFGLLLTRDVHRFELDASKGQGEQQKSTGPSLVETKTRLWQVGLGANFRHLAVHSLVWQLGTRLSYESYQEDTLSPSLTTSLEGPSSSMNLIVIGLRPALGVDLSQDVTASLGIEFAHGSSLKNSTMPQYEGTRASLGGQLEWMF